MAIALQAEGGVIDNSRNLLLRSKKRFRHSTVVRVDERGVEVATSTTKFHVSPPIYNSLGNLSAWVPEWHWGEVTVNLNPGRAVLHKYPARPRITQRLIGEPLLTAVEHANSHTHECMRRGSKSRGYFGKGQRMGTRGSSTTISIRTPTRAIHRPSKVGDPRA